MKYLLYCIFNTPAEENHSLRSKSGSFQGVRGQPVLLVSNNGLTAAITAIEVSGLTPDITNIRAYKKVIELFHRDRTVIPVRYGSLFAEESQLIHLLGDGEIPYKTLLKELEGCVEMGIRTLIPKSEMSNTESAGMDAFGDKSHKPQFPTDNPQSPTAGLAYIATLRAKYGRETRLKQETAEIKSRICRMFTDLFVKCHIESTLLLPFSHPPHRTPLLSLYFLVPRGMVETFRQTFQQLVRKERMKFLLSGPWPPYNFVLPDPSRNALI